MIPNRGEVVSFELGPLHDPMYALTSILVTHLSSARDGEEWRLRGMSSHSVAFRPRVCLSHTVTLPLPAGTVTQPVRTKWPTQGSASWQLGSNPAPVVVVQESVVVQVAPSGSAGASVTETATPGMAAPPEKGARVARTAKLMPGRLVSYDRSTVRRDGPSAMLGLGNAWR